MVRIIPCFCGNVKRKSIPHRRKFGSRITSCGVGWAGVGVGVLGVSGVSRVSRVSRHKFRCYGVFREVAGYQGI